MKVAVLLVGLAGGLGGAAAAWAAASPVGTWTKRAEAGQPEMTMTIASWGVGDTRISYSLGKSGVVATVDSNLDGADSPVLANGKATPATMAITLVDAWRATAVSKMNLRPIGTSRWTFSPDFETLTVENDFTRSLSGVPAGKSVERWTRRQ